MYRSRDALFADECGKEFLVIEYQEMVRGSSLLATGRSAPRNGLKHLRLSDGEPVNYIDEDTVALLSKKRLTRVSEWND